MQVITIPFDHHLTPVSVFAAFREIFGAPCAILESMSFDERNQMSLVAANPIQSIVSSEDSFAKIKTAIAKCQPMPNQTSLPFQGGMIGFFNYEIFGEIESKFKDTLKSDKARTVFHEFSTFACFDHQAKTILFFDTQKEDFEDLDEILFFAQNFHALKKYAYQALKNDQYNHFDDITSELTKVEHAENITHIKEEILAGQIFQAVYSNTFSVPFDQDPLRAYQLLRMLEPTTHLYLLDFAENEVVCGASPEILGSKRGNEVLYRPIAGTRKRGQSLAEDDVMLKEMQNDPKENMEHDMLLDLGRNDLGRIAKPGSVTVTREKYAKKFANVQHLVSDLKAEIKDEYDGVDFFEAIFPAGTLTGAPKIRAIDILHRIETSPRGIYGGAVGYFSADQNMEFAIAIRTFFLQNGVAHFRAGGGIVTDSDPDKEWKEIHNKARTLVKIFNYLKQKES